MFSAASLERSLPASNVRRTSNSLMKLITRFDHRPLARLAYGWAVTPEQWPSRFGRRVRSGRWSPCSLPPFVTLRLESRVVPTWVSCSLPSASSSPISFTMPDGDWIMSGGGWNAMSTSPSTELPPKSFAQIHDFMKQRVTASATSHLIETGIRFVRGFPRRPQGEGKLPTGRDHGKGSSPLSHRARSRHFCLALVRHNDGTILSPTFWIDH